MYANINSLSQLALASKTEHTIAVYQGQLINNTQFNADVQALANSLSHHKTKQFALYYDEAYVFAVSLFALLHSNKEVWIAANNKTITADKLLDQGCELLGDWEGKELVIEPQQLDQITLQALDMNKQSLLIFTSGSSGQAKTITKSLQQFQSEIETLESCWGQQLAQAQVLATVSHQHIYGLLFRVLWPLAAGRCFHSQMYLSPEPLLKAASDIAAYWVASPAQLKRLDELTPWQSIAKLAAIFSSGGALAITAAKQIQDNCQHKVLEIYGSSETGGIAWRQSVDDALWTTFKGIEVSVDEQGVSYLKSPYLVAKSPFVLDDKIKMAEEGRFALLGRVDRIVKVEEKRLSLDELEQQLIAYQWIEQAYTLVLTGKREKVAAILVLSVAGQDYLQQQGRAALIKMLRQQLMQSFETVLLPKKWLMMHTLPLTSQGKVNRGLLEQLLAMDSNRFPQILDVNDENDSVDLQLKVLPELIYFAGHFPEQPILPGVTQLAWAESFGKIFFNISQPFLRMEVVKFKKIIRPNDIIRMKLNWKSESSKLYFELSSLTDSHSSGRIVYGKQE